MSEELKAYYDQKNVKEFMVDITKALLQDMPDDPTSYLIEYLTAKFKVPTLTFAPSVVGDDFWLWIVH